MPRRLTLAQRLVEPDGSASPTAKALAIALVAAAAGGGFAAQGRQGAPEAPQRETAIAASRLAGEATQGGPAPRLTRTARLPALPAARPRARAGSQAPRTPQVAAAPTATPKPKPKPKAAPTPTPDAAPAPAPSAVPQVPVATPAPVPVRPPAPARPPARPRPPGPTFDSSG